MKNKSILNTVSKVMTKLALGAFMVQVPIFSSTLLNSLSPKGENIRDKIHLEKLLKQEKKKLGIENKNINAYFCNTIETSGARKINENSYEIFLAKDQRAFNVLRHELYHVADGHCDKGYELFNNGRKFEKTIRYLLINEPKASIYGATGLKL